MDLTEDYDDIRGAVRKLCAQLADEYWRKLDREHQLLDRVTAVTSTQPLASLTASVRLITDYHTYRL